MNSNPTKFWDGLAERYAKSPVKNEEAYQHKLEITREYLDPNTNVFEFGCGTGSTSIAHAPYVNHILAIDISAKMLKIAEEKALAANIDNIDFKQADISEMPVPETLFDVVMGHSILHLVKDREEVIQKARGLLKPGGIFITSTACLGDTSKLLKYVLSFAHFLGLVPLVQVFTKEELAKSIKDSGFNIVYQWRPKKGEAEFIVAERV